MEEIEDVIMLNEALELRSDIFILMWEMKNVLKYVTLSYRQQDDINKMLIQLDKDYVFIDKLINKLNREIDNDRNL